MLEVVFCSVFFDRWGDLIRHRRRRRLKYELSEPFHDDQRLSKSTTFSEIPETLLLSDIKGLPYERQMEERLPLVMHDIAKPFASIVPGIDYVLKAEPDGHRREAKARNRGQHSRND